MRLSALTARVLTPGGAQGAGRDDFGYRIRGRGHAGPLLRDNC